MILSYFHDPRCRTSRAARPRCTPRRISSVDSPLPTLCSLCPLRPSPFCFLLFKIFSASVFHPWLGLPSFQPLDRNIPEHHRIIMPGKTEMPAHAIFALMRHSIHVI